MFLEVASESSSIFDKITCLMFNSFTICCFKIWNEERERLRVRQGRGGSQEAQVDAQAWLVQNESPYKPIKHNSFPLSSEPQLCWLESSLPNVLWRNRVRQPKNIMQYCWASILIRYDSASSRKASRNHRCWLWIWGTALYSQQNVPNKSHIWVGDSR